MAIGHGFGVVAPQKRLRQSGNIAAEDFTVILQGKQRQPDERVDLHNRNEDQKRLQEHFPDWSGDGPWLGLFLQHDFYGTHAFCLPLLRFEQ
ncbi:hypothetical protein D3C74_369970 [compost metagenome]